MPFEKPSHVPSNRARMMAPTTPQGRHYRVALVYKNFGRSGSNHIGLGVTALNTAKYLQAMGIFTDVWGVTNIDGLAEKIAQSKDSTMHPVTHIVISAPWLPSADLQDLAILNDHIVFSSVSHSNIPFLAADPNAFRLVKEYIDVERGTKNFHMAGNSDRFANWIQNTYSAPAWTIPNLYMLDGAVNPNRPVFSGDTLRIGCFGAMRILKNILSAGAAAMHMAAGLRVNLEFWISTGRNEGAQGTLQSLQQMFAGAYWAKLVGQPWGEWSAFRNTVRHMHLMMQPSFTESFNNVTADGIAEGVASVVSTAINWCPDDWKANSDDADDIARVGKRLLYDAKAPSDGLAALVAYNTKSFAAWEKFLGDTTAHM